MSSRRRMSSSSYSHLRGLDMEKLRSLRKNKLFRRIEADIKERDRKRQPGHYEEYVDRDRLIAVTLGESDIRETMFRQRMYLTKNPEMMYEEEQNFKILLQQGEHEIRRGAYDKALAYLDKAVRMVPTDIESLILRSTCYAGTQQYNLALQDVDTVLEVEPCSRAFLIKGDTLYQTGDFEHALVFYHRALSRSCSTKEEEIIRFGIGRAEKAVDNALGAKADAHFVHMRALIGRIPREIFGLSWQELKALGDEKNKAQARQQVILTKPGAVTSQRSKTKYGEDVGKREPKYQARPRTKEESKYHRALLGTLTKDLDYLETLVLGVGKAQCANAPAVRKEAEDAISFLCRRREFWRQFKPMYAEA